MSIEFNKVLKFFVGSQVESKTGKIFEEIGVPAEEIFSQKNLKKDLPYRKRNS